MNLLSRAEEIILLAVYKLRDRAYGVTIREQIHRDLQQYWSFGAIYKTLKKLKTKGYIKKIAGDPVAERGGRSKYFYHLTEDGSAALSDILDIHTSLWNQVVLTTGEQEN